MLVTAIQHQQQELQKLLTAEDASNPLVAVQIRSAKAMLEAEERHRKELAEPPREQQRRRTARCTPRSAS